MTKVHLPTGITPSSSEPVEYKDAPIRFTFVIAGREEPVKVVEPTLDLPFPDGALLLVEEKGKRICEVTFRFDREAGQPYRLVLKRRGRTGRWGTQALAYGKGVAPENEMTAVYRKIILERGNLRVRIEMTRRKARLQIDYRPGRRIPPPTVL